MSTDRYTSFVSGGFGSAVAGRLGLPKPAILRRHAPDAPFLVGDALLIGAGFGAEVSRKVLARNGAAVGDGELLGAIVVDGSGVTAPGDLHAVYAGLRDCVKRLGNCARVVFFGRDDAGAPDPTQAAASAALTGLMRSLGRELRNGATANMIQLVGEVPTDPDDSVDNALQFLLGARSAYVDGQLLRVGPGTGAQLPEDPTRPLAGRTALVTGAARGIGAQIATVLARQGASVILADLAVSGQALAAQANQIGGTAVQLDITAADAGARISDAAARHGGLDIVVHNAGITKDRMLVNLEPARWDAVLAVNLEAQLQLDEILCAPDGPVHDGGRMVSLSSIAGIAGNRGQSNYAASKAGVIGMVGAQAKALAQRGITYNAVAPGLIETDMAAAIPMAMREISRRLNSLGQGGQPVDVAEAVAFLAEPRSGGITGQVLRVCGQSLVGA